MRAFLLSVRYAVRTLRSSPAFAASAVAALGLGIGASTAIFSAVYAVLLRPLPYFESDRLVFLKLRDPESLYARVSYATYADWKERSRSLEAISAFRGWEPALTGEGEAVVLAGMRVTHEFFNLLGAVMLEGRAFQVEEDRPGAGHVVILSEGLWRERWGGRKSILGQSILLDHAPYTVVGILPDRFRPAGTGILDRPALWTPLCYDRSLSYGCRNCNHLQVIARLRPGKTVSAAAAELNAAQRALNREYPRVYAADAAVSLTPLAEELAGRARPTLLVLLGAVALVLLIACANVASLLLVRGTRRVKEIAVRAALGAGRGQILQHLLVESLVLGLAGGAAGLLIALWGLPVLASLGPAGLAKIPRLNEASINAPVLLFALALSVLTGVLFGLVPAVKLSGLALSQALREGRGYSDGSGRRGLRSLFVVGQLALALMLVTAAALLGKSFFVLSSVDPGFAVKNLLTVSLDILGSVHERNRQAPEFYGRVLDQVRGVAGVESAAAVNILPIGGAFDRYTVCIDNKPDCFGPGAPEVDRFVITPGYFQAMRIPVVSGRTFDQRDRRETQPVAVIGESMARRLWPGTDPVGKTLRLYDSLTWRLIVGVVGDVRLYGLDVAPALEVYLPHAQHPVTGMTLAVRSARGDAGALASAVRRQVAALDKDQPVARVITMDALVARSMGQRRLVAWLSAVFAALAVVLAAIGLYGVVSYSASLRAREIGIRVALGARRSDILQMVLRQGLLLIAAGVAIGLAGALAAERLLQSLMYGAARYDPAVIGGVAVLLAVVALSATFLPARRASTADPLTALRQE